MSAVYQPTNHERVSRSVNSKRHGISFSTKQSREAKRPARVSGFYCVGVELAF